MRMAQVKSELRYVATRAKRTFNRTAPKPAKDLARRAVRHFRDHRTVRFTSEATYPAVKPGSPLSTPPAPPHLNLRVGCILDEFSYQAWSPEFELLPINPGQYDLEFLKSLDFLLVESAWNGNQGAWKYQLVGQNAPSQELQQLVNACKQVGVPTLFWNKEDPPHFDDFLKTATLFDFIATSDANRIPHYRKLVPATPVFTLPFAAQPNVQNPARNGLTHLGGNIAFAGTYFREKFPERRNQMDLLLGAAHSVSQSYGLRFEIFSRHAGGENKYQFPSKWTGNVSGSLPYSQMLAAYRCFDVFLNVNSVVDSPSMCARRIFEIAASGTPVVTTESKALRRFFSSEEVISVNETSQAEHTLRALVGSEMLRRRTAHVALRRVWENHTYRVRAQLIARNLGLEQQDHALPKVTIICSTNRDRELSHLLQQAAGQRFKNLELCVIGHGIEIDPAFTNRAMQAGLKARVFSAPAEATLGECLNKLVAESTGQIIAKFDDDDYYLPNYLRDQVNALINMNADLVGKSSIYFYLSEPNLLVRRWKHQEHTWRNFVSGSTFVGWREVFTDNQFAAKTQGEDSEFLLQLERKGLNVYSADSFNYIAVRGNSTHTWGITNTEILANSEVETIGLNFQHVEV